MKHRLAGAVVIMAHAGRASLSCAATATAPANPVGGQMTSLVISTLAVIALIVAAAWLLKRIAPRQYARNDMLRVVAGTAVGQRERVVVVEIGATWLVLGVAPGQVHLLHHLPRAEAPASDAGAPLIALKPRTFAQWLTAVSKKI